MSKLPWPPGIAALRAIAPQTLTVPADTPLARIYFAAGPHPARWSRFRNCGPVDARWDHHLPDARGNAAEQSRSILYCAPDIDTCVAEVFQATRRIDRTRGGPWLVLFALGEPITLLDLRGTFATTIGASTAIHSGPRSRTRGWARELYEAYPNVQGVHYGSSMNGHAPAMALNERARSAIPRLPLFHRALNDDMLVDILRHSAQRLSYGLR